MLEIFQDSLPQCLLNKADTTLVSKLAVALKMLKSQIEAVN